MLPGTQLPQKATLSIEEGSELEVYCPFTSEIYTITYSSKQGLCKEPPSEAVKMRSDENVNAPVLISPRTRKIMDLSSITWGGPVDSQYKVSIFELGDKGKIKIFASDILTLPKNRKKFPLYRYGLDDKIKQKLESSKLYEIIITDVKTGWDSSSGKLFSGIVTLLSDVEKKEIANNLPDANESDDISHFLHAVALKEMEYFSDSYEVIHNVTSDNFKHLVKFQMASLFLRQSVPVDFIAFELVRAIQFSIEAKDNLTAFLSCKKLNYIYYRLSPAWKREIKKFANTREFKEVCPLF